MSSRASSTVGNMPPRHGKKLADVMDEAFRNNNKAVDEANGERAQGDAGSGATAALPNAEIISAPAKSQSAGKTKGYTFQITSVYPPQPCERCVRSKKICLGIAGARCENCKSLHQKCSNSTGPPRGRHAAVRQNSRSSSIEDHDTAVEPARTKRKQTAKAKQTDNASVEGGDDEGTSNPAPKKRRVSGNAKTTALKGVAELDAAIKKLQSSVTKDLKHLAQLAAALSAQLNEMD